MISFYIHDSRIANNDASTNRSAFSCNLLKANGEEDKTFGKSGPALSPSRTFPRWKNH
jgi:hypothetical protein